jgi:hypothetical protein
VLLSVPRDPLVTHGATVTIRLRTGGSDCRPLWGCTGGQLEGWGKDVAAGATDKRDA